MMRVALGRGCTLTFVTLSGRPAANTTALIVVVVVVVLVI